MENSTKNKEFKPYIKENHGLKEITPKVVIIGILLTILFAASNSYAALTAGMTVAAGIPGAILGGGILTIISKKSNALNTNIIQGMSSGGESIASGMTFVLPAIFLIGADVSFFTGFILGVVGVLIGIGVTSLIHNYLIIQEHGKIVYPEAMAISGTVKSADEGGEGLKTMGKGAALGGIITLVSSQITGLFSTTFSLVGEKYKYQFQTDANPLLLGIGFIVGIEVGIAMLAGAILANFVFMPLIGYFATNADPLVTAWNNSSLNLVDMTAGDIQGTYTKYIGAGIMLGGGIIGAIKLIPIIISSIKETLSVSVSKEDSNEGSSITGLLIISGIVLLVISSFFITSNILMAVVAIILILIFSFLFSVVAARMVGDIGTSNLPVSGMTIASLLIITVVFVIFGNITGSENWTNTQGNLTILLALTSVVTAISISAGYIQTQKVNYVLGGNKNKVQRFFVLAAIIGVATSVGVMMLLSDQIVNHPNVVPAPQANLMASITQGILQNSLPWTIIFVGLFISLILYMLRLPIMSVAIGFYLPIGTVTIIFIGGLVRVAVNYLNKKDQRKLEKKIDRGTIFSSGLIAGGSLVGLLGAFLAVFAGTEGMTSYSFYLGSESGPLFSSNIISLMVIFIMTIITFIFINRRDKNEK